MVEQLSSRVGHVLHLVTESVFMGVGGVVLVVACLSYSGLLVIASVLDLVVGFLALNRCHHNWEFSETSLSDAVIQMPQ